VRRSKDQIQQRIAEMRDLWWQWDPIGVATLPQSLRDEYDAYLGPTLGLLEQRAPLEALVQYLTDVELQTMGLSETAPAKMRRRIFANTLKIWFEATLQRPVV
jgi:hypothetical protein